DPVRRAGHTRQRRAGGRRAGRSGAGRGSARPAPRGRSGRTRRRRRDRASQLGVRRPALTRCGNPDRFSGPVGGASGVSDRVLWRRARDGDGAAFGILFERHAGRIYNYCFRRTADWALAEDLTSATFLVAWRGHGRESLNAESALPLLYGIATNVLRNQ